MITRRLIAMCCMFAFPACQDGQSGPTAAPSSQPLRPPASSSPPPATAAGRVAVKLKTDGAPAVAKPAPEDVGWKRPSYERLAPSRPDGKPTFSNKWFDNNAENWARHLGHLKGQKNLRYLEVGVFEGQSLLWMFDSVLTDPSSTAVAIDLFDFEGLEARFRENLDRGGVTDRVQVIKAYSNVGLRPLEPGSFDLIYIDASHTGANVLRDGILAWDLLKEGGILIFDDYGLRPRYPAAIRPGAVIDTFVTAFYKEVELLDRGWQVLLRRRPTGCWDNCSTLGPYYYHWDHDNPQAIGTGTLFDPRTGARVPITVQEGAVVEGILLSRPLGSLDPAPTAADWNAPQTQALIKRLDLQ